MNLFSLFQSLHVWDYIIGKRASITFIHESFMSSLESDLLVHIFPSFIPLYLLHVLCCLVCFILLHGHRWWKISIDLSFVAFHNPIQIFAKKIRNEHFQNYLCDYISSWHLLGCINILHTHWHISERYILSRVSFSIKLLHIFVGDILVRSLGFSDVDCLFHGFISHDLFLPFLTNFIPRNFQSESFNYSQPPNIKFEDILCWFHLVIVWPAHLCIPSKDEILSFDQYLKIEHWSMLSTTTWHNLYNI